MKTLLASAPGLEGRRVTADLFHCQKDTARIICEKGGECFLAIQANQPVLLRYARRQTAGDTPFFVQPANGPGRMEEREASEGAADPAATVFPSRRAMIKSARIISCHGRLPCLRLPVRIHCLRH